jgi:hypothetical protein
MDALLGIWLKTKKYLTQIVLSVMVVLTVAVVYYYMQERIINPPETVRPVDWVPPPIITNGTVASSFLTTFSQPVLSIQESDNAIIFTQSIWERREGTSQDDLQREALALYQRALRAYQAGNLQQALQLTNDAARRVPNYTENNRLREQIQNELGGATNP